MVYKNTFLRYISFIFAVKSPTTDVNYSPVSYFHISIYPNMYYCIHKFVRSMYVHTLYKYPFPSANGSFLCVNIWSFKRIYLFGVWIFNTTIHLSDYSHLNGTEKMSDSPCSDRYRSFDYSNQAIASFLVLKKKGANGCSDVQLR